LIKKFTSIAIIIFAISNLTFAQSEKKLIGKWDVKFPQGSESATLEFKNINGTIVGYFTSHKGVDGKNRKTNDLVHTNVVFDGRKGRSRYTLEMGDQSFSFDTNFKMIDKKTIHSTYTYQGMKLKETWVRKK